MLLYSVTMTLQIINISFVIMTMNIDVSHITPIPFILFIFPFFAFGQFDIGKIQEHCYI